ncbi:4-aminobutyrate--2-oxoglutarate transaminase [Pseudokordiimonas caeni]|uniref:4-aminobutyrate--2-oxoglutarate transaminase n=1 Tax=Pseudokordiimonas caeni TaxID=2997908 RepID=UPI0028111F10|nr:4-aminobutyrate--2-oxoglutarate transaminase [Pseudokordiimonas caeni]
MSKNAELLARRQAAVPRGVASATPIFAERAENAELWDADGRRYLDFAVGIAVCNTGHRHPKVIGAVEEQLKRFTHTAFQVSAYEPYIALAERLNEAAPIKDAKTIFFTTGAEAVENAIKVARVATGRQGVIAFRGAFHGRTALTGALTGKIVPYRMGAGPAVPGIYHAPFPVPHHGVSVDDAFYGLETIFKVEIEARDVAAIIVEPVQGEGGFYVAPKDFMVRLRKLCDDHGILLICDEIQTGFARTGKLFATEHYDVEPDLITVAKALAGGFPLSGLIGKASIIDTPLPGGMGGTYGGSPIGIAAAHAVMDVIAEEKLCARAEKIGARMKERLEAMKVRGDTAPIGDVRGLGAMVAFELVTEKGGNVPNPAATSALVAKALSHGLIILSCGYWANTIRLLAPITVPDDQLEEGLDMLEKALVDVAAAAKAA